MCKRLLRKGQYGVVKSGGLVAVRRLAGGRVHRRISGLGPGVNMPQLVRICWSRVNARYLQPVRAGVSFQPGRTRVPSGHLALVRSAPVRSAPVRSARTRNAPRRFAPQLRAHRLRQPLTFNVVSRLRRADHLVSYGHAPSCSRPGLTGASLDLTVGWPPRTYVPVSCVLFRCPFRPRRC